MIPVGTTETLKGIDISTKKRKPYDMVREDVINKDRKFLGVRCAEVNDDVDVSMVVAALRKYCRILDKVPKLRCLGLAANQIGFHWRIFVIKNQRGKYEAFVNPRIVKETGEFLSNETCYSAPGCTRDIIRRTTVTVTDWTGKAKTFRGIMAACVQHEIDHLDGKILGEKA